jgi:2-polyprenyl-6-hydroxyphenyl methylase/3-demethylubiquinone-9 3-methyltransferase
VDVLDLACGGGFLANALALEGHRVVGLDASPGSLEVARAHDRTGTVRYEVGDAYRLPYPDGSFDAVCCMDFLEHVDNPARVVFECARVLRAGGRFYFYTFNRNFLSWLLVIKGVEWVVPNTPPRMHVLRLFLTPREMRAIAEAAGLSEVRFTGTRPAFRSVARLVASRRVPRDFRFHLTGSLAISYLGSARKG